MGLNAAGQGREKTQVDRGGLPVAVKTALKQVSTWTAPRRAEKPAHWGRIFVEAACSLTVLEPWTFSGFLLNSIKTLCPDSSPRASGRH